MKCESVCYIDTTCPNTVAPLPSPILKLSMCNFSKPCLMTIFKCIICSSLSVHYQLCVTGCSCSNGYRLRCKI